MDTLSKLCAWYQNQCVNDWHEDHQIRIGTLDNPGWSLKIDLEGTALHKKSFEEINIERSNENWIVARKADATFEAFGDPKALDAMIKIFLDWVE